MIPATVVISYALGGRTEPIRIVALKDTLKLDLDTGVLTFTSIKGTDYTLLNVPVVIQKRGAKL